MKSILVVVLFFCASNSIHGQSNGDIQDKVKRAHQSFITGILAEDYKLIDELLSADVTLGFPHGGFTPKIEFVGALKNKTLFYDSAYNQSLDIRIFGNIAVVNGRADLVFRFKNENGVWYKMLEHLSFTTVYLYDKQKIKMVAWQSNRPVTDQTVRIEE